MWFNVPRVKVTVSVNVVYCVATGNVVWHANFCWRLSRCGMLIYRYRV